MALTQISTNGIKDATIATADIADNAVTAAKIQDGEVTQGKLASNSVTTNKISGSAVTSGEIANNAVTSAKIADNAVVTAAINADAVTAAKIATDAVGSAEIAANAVTSAHIAANTITAADIATDAVGSAELAADAVTGAHIADDAINSEHYTDGSIDTAHIADSQVTTDKIADDAITNAKIADGAVGGNQLGGNAVTAAKIGANEVTSAAIAAGAVGSAKIADQAVTLDKLPHGTGSNDGKFLRANNGADPTFETVTGTTINNNADNRLITGSGTANTLEGESTITYSNPTLEINTDTSAYGTLNLNGNSGGLVQFEDNEVTKWSLFGDSTFSIYDNSGSANRIKIDSSGKVGVNESSPQQQLHVHDDTAYKGILVNGNGAPRVGYARGTTTSGEWSTGIDGTNGNYFVINNSNDNSNRRVIVKPDGIALNGTVTKSTQPFFWAYNSSNYSWNNNTISFETEANDQGGNYNNSTYTFTCPVGGVYLFCVYMRTGGSFSEFSWTLQKNGGNFIRIIGQGSFAGNDCSFGQTIQNCAANDTWRVHGSGNHGGATGGYQYNGFQGYLLG